MSETVAPAHAALTPSEVVLLLGESFAPAAGKLGFKEELLLTGARVESEPLATAAVRAALRAAVEAGSLVVELEQQKALFGLVRRMRVRLRPGATPHAFPEGTMEAALVQRAPTFLRDAVVAMIAEESADPAARLLGFAKHGLVARGLLGTEEKKTLKIFTSTVVTVPQATRALAERTGPDATLALLARGGQADAELWKRIAAEVDDALQFMVPSRD